MRRAVILVNRSLARRAWKNDDVVGKRITFDGEHYLEIVGVVGDVREFGPREDAPVQLYRPMSQDPFAGNVLVRTAADPELLIPAVRRAVLDANPESAVVKVQTLDEARAEAVASPRTTAQLFGLFAALALVIAVAGIGSMLALWVRQRMREIGIRMALGAGPRRHSLHRAAAGHGAGRGGTRDSDSAARWCSRGRSSELLFAVTPTDLPTYVVVSALLLGAALVACWIPARRAARIDPQVALHAE